ncbi:MAG: hypothetical protein JF593_11110, partial [Novosphingobium sp.]|nr:hypothetical protein [Novosphingobium sp.]
MSNIIRIRSRSDHPAPVPKALEGRDCGPAGCQVDWLASKRVEAELDIEAFNRFALAKGWGDGLPLVPPTEGRVRTFLAANDRFPD